MMSRCLLFLGSAVACAGALFLLYKGLRMVIREEESHRVRWLQAECRILSSGYEDTYIACSDDCAEVSECNGQKVKWGCASPCCDFKWWYAYWTVSSASFRNGDRYSAYHCSHHQRSFFSGSQPSRFCNSTVLEADARAVSRTKAVGSLVPCWVDEFQTDLKMSGDDEVHESNTFIGMLYVVVGFAPIWCCLLSATAVLAERYCSGAGRGGLPQKRRDTQLIVDDEEDDDYESAGSRTVSQVQSEVRTVSQVQSEASDV